MSIHQRIKSRRIALQLQSHKALADLVGVSWQTVQLWEKEGGTAPNRNRIAKVAEVLQVSVEWLTTGQGDTPLAHLENVLQEAPAVARMALHYITPREERLLEQFRLSFEEGREKIEMAADSTKKRSLSGVDGHQVQNRRH